MGRIVANSPSAVLSHGAGPRLLACQKRIPNEFRATKVLHRHRILRAKQGNATALGQWRSWLRGVDLNRRPLGYAMQKAQVVQAAIRGRLRNDAESLLKLYPPVADADIRPLGDDPIPISNPYWTAIGQSMCRSVFGINPPNR
jgi:hypothetical protein